GNPLDSVAVSTESIFANYLVYTNPNGEYSIDTMMTGTYDITFELEHYNVMVEEDVEILPNQTTILDMIMTAPTMSIYPTYIDTSMIPNTQLTVYLTISNDGDGPLHWYAHIGYPELLKRAIQNFISASFYKEKIKLCNAPIDCPSYAEECPYQTTSNYTPAKDTWDILFAYDVDTPSGGIGIAGAEFGNGYFLVSEWGHSSRNVFKFDVNGNYISSWEPTWIQGPAGLRDMAFDGEYFYGSNAENTIYSFDEDGNLQGTINSPVVVRSIAYDEQYDAFWVNNWNSDIKLVDRSGNVLNTIYAPPSMYGSAYDNITPSGPYLWIFTGTSTGDGCQVEQYNLNTLTLTGVSHSVSGDFLGTIAGGLFTSGDVVVGTWVLGGLAQGSPDILFGYDLGYWPPPPPPMQGIIEAGQSYDWPLTMYSYGQTPGTVLTADIIFTSDPDVGTITIPVTLTIIGSGVDDVLDISTKLNQNFPNPFSTSTTISFNIATDLHRFSQIKIYNIKGQLVKTLIPMTNDNPRFTRGQMTTTEWDGKDENGNQVSSGIYFYRLQIGDKVIDVKKCLLLK
ncbi:MAG: T9SS type A sorting domain-containing protein, partial [Candidatus Cloacimonetes bacterium]|nr:T9SS type A sorting domain-containing protein [Candidatus Cloacimonadota bacterium]